MKRRIILTLLPLVLLLAAPARGQTSMAAVLDDGYAGKALQKIMKSYSARAVGAQKIEAKLFLDAEGNYIDCRAIKGDANALCQAAKKESPFGTPPYGVPTAILLSVISGTQHTDGDKSAPQRNDGKVGGAKGRLDAKYLAKARTRLRNAMYIPVETLPGTYNVTALVACDAKGKILQSSIVKSSGDSRLDKYVLQGIKRAGSVAAPPSGEAETFELTFKLVRE